MVPAPSAGGDWTGGVAKSSHHGLHTWSPLALREGPMVLPGEGQMVPHTGGKGRMVPHVEGERRELPHVRGEGQKVPHVIEGSDGWFLALRGKNM